MLALAALEQGSPTAAYNLGTGRGYTVYGSYPDGKKGYGARGALRGGFRRPGDPAVLVASAEKAIEELGGGRGIPNWKTSLLRPGSGIAAGREYLKGPSTGLLKPSRFFMPGRP
ncbi:hypothetical protein [Neomoorella thermoacetica]|uniref:hypothetical protein n=1 Tax=Neomoorella thermoacetica TaxID=1525 RepID=UPI0008FBACF3|nr:hypothetical protein [Moorella thermoacetica]